MLDQFLVQRIGQRESPIPRSISASSTQWVHRITVFNNNDSSAVLSGFSLLPTMVNYTDLLAVPWTPANQVIGSAGVTIAPHGSFQYDLVTPTSLVDGNVFFRYALTPTGVPESMQVIGVHPVFAIPEPATYLLLLGGVFALALRWKSRQRS